MTRLIDADKLKKSTCDKGVCSDCEDFHKGTNVSTNCSEVRWYFLEKINEQPTVEVDSTLREKALLLLVTWAEECGFGYDNFPEEYETYKDEIEGMGYIDGMIYIAERVVEHEDD